MIAALSDERQVTGLEKTNWASGTSFTVSDLAEEHQNLPIILAHFKCRQAVPMLLRMAAREKPSRMAIMALGELDDERAVPVLLEILRRCEPELRISMGMLDPEPFVRAVAAIGKLKA